MSSAASRMADLIILDIKAEKFDDIALRSRLLTLTNIRDNYGKTCQAVLIAYALILAFVYAFLILGKSELEIFEIKLELTDRTIFILLIVGNMLSILQISSFFKVIVIEKVLHFFWTRGYFGSISDQILWSHSAFVGTVIRRLDQKSSPSTSFLSSYISVFFVIIYSLFYYILVSMFIVKLIADSLRLFSLIPVSAALSAQNTHQAVEYTVYALVLIFVNVMATWISIWLLRDLSPH